MVKYIGLAQHKEIYKINYWLKYFLGETDLHLHAHKSFP